VIQLTEIRPKQPNIPEIRSVSSRAIIQAGSGFFAPISPKDINVDKKETENVKARIILAIREGFFHVYDRSNFKSAVISKIAIAKYVATTTK